VQNLTVVSPAGTLLVDDVSFEVRAGEILCIAGVQGNGQTELAETILGLEEADAGRILLDGKDLLKLPVRDRLRAGLGFVPEDRSTDGVISSFSIAENLILDLYDSEPFARGITMSPAKVASNATRRSEEFDVRYTDVQDPISTLSGGNAQKVVLAREMSRPLRLLVASQPTRGLDVGSIEFVHKRVVRERDQGTPCIIVSTELDEVLGLADRIAVMYRGRIVGIVDVAEEQRGEGGGVNRDMLGLMMAGVPMDEARVQAAEHHSVLGRADLEEETP
jgi:general nucleoside transport system ATP-binding protein